jgi:hypothetical protein
MGTKISVRELERKILLERPKPGRKDGIKNGLQILWRPRIGFFWLTTDTRSGI